MSQNPTVVYTALFVKDIPLLLQTFEPAHKNVYGHHSTIAFRPGSLEGIEVGKQQVIKVIGRAVDEKGDVLLVENSKSTFAYPHVTLSTAKNVPPVYSNELIEKAENAGLIEYFNEPTEIDVVEGYFDGEKDVIAK